MDLNETAARVIAARVITDDDVAALRRAIWSQPVIGQQRVDQLFAINDALAAPHNGWSDLFGEALCHHLLREGELRNFLDDAAAEWLIARLDHDGRIESHAELDALIRLIELAENVPVRLKQFALRAIEALVISGSGPTRDGSVLRPGSIEATEVKLLRRLIFASGGGDGGHVGSLEAEALFRIKQAVAGGANASEWQRLFVQGVANHLLAYQRFTPLELRDAKRLDAAMEDTQVNLTGFFDRVLSRDSLRSAFSIFSHDDRPAIDHEAGAATAQALSAAEANWLKREIISDGTTDDAEKALLAFLIDENVVLDQSLDGLRRTG